MLSQGIFCSNIHGTTHLTYGCKSTDKAESQYNQFKVYAYENAFSKL